MIGRKKIEKDRMRQSDIRPANEYSLADAVVRTCFLSMIALFCLYSAVWMAQDIFPGWMLSGKAGWWLHAAVVVTAGVCEAVIRAFPRWLRILCRLGIMLLYAYVGFRYYKAHQIDLEDGACAMASQFLVKFNRHLKTFFSVWRGKTELIGLAFAFWTFAVLLGLLLLALFVNRHEILLLLPAAVFTVELLIGYIPQWKGLALLFAALLFVHADGGNSAKTTLRVHADRKRRLAQAWYLPWLPAFCLGGTEVLILFCSSRLSDATAQQWMNAAPKVQTFQRQAEQSISNIWRGYFIPRQETVSNQTPHYTGKEMFKLTASKCPAETVLLKGFCGTDYQNGSWVCDRQRFANACAEAGYEEEEAARELLGTQYDLFSQRAERIRMQYSFGGGFSIMNTNENERTDYKLEHTGIRSKYAFLPYAAEHREGENAERLIGDLTVQKSWRQDTFYYSGWDHFTGGIYLDAIPQEGRSQVFSWYDEFARKAYLGTSDRIPTVNEYLGAMQELRERMEKLLSSSYIPVEEESEEQDGELQESLENYLVHSSESGIEEEPGASDFLPRYLKEARHWMILMHLQQQAAYIDDVSWRNQNRLQLALVISATLKMYQSYSMDLDPLPENEDPINYFLMHSQKGYCMHFASAAVLMLREMGVPARYASGYAVRTTEFRQKDDSYVASVKDRNAHAWVEIYLDQIGWVPIDVTPGVETQVQRTEDERVPDAEEQETQTDTNTDDTQTDTGDTQTDTDDTQTDTDDTQTDTDGAVQQEDEDKPIWQQYSLLIVAAAILLTVLIIYLICRQMIRFYQMIPKREIQAGKYGKAVRRINWRIYCRMCVRRRIPRRYLSDAQYEQMLKTVYQEVSIEDWEHFMQLVRSAAYAQDEVPRREAEFCWHIYQVILRKSANQT